MIRRNNGWDVFDSSRGLTIQRDDELGIFQDDIHAILYVIRMAEASPHARAALICVALQDRELWEQYLHTGVVP